LTPRWRTFAPSADGCSTPAAWMPWCIHVRGSRKSAIVIRDGTDGPAWS